MMNFYAFTQMVMVCRLSYFFDLWYSKRLGSSSISIIILLYTRHYLHQWVGVIRRRVRDNFSLITMDPRRLCHISDLPNSLHFLPIEIKHLLPVHHPKFIDNLLTILSSQATNLEWPIYQDQSLTLTSVTYASVSAGWCEDIDGQPNHLKATLELSSIILNYLHSMLSSSSQK